MSDLAALLHEQLTTSGMASCVHSPENEWMPWCEEFAARLEAAGVRVDIRPCQWCGMDRADRCVCNTITSALSRSAAPRSEEPDSLADALHTHHQPDTTCPICRYAQDHLAAPPSEDAAPLDVERLARAIDAVEEGGVRNGVFERLTTIDNGRLARSIAREYARPHGPKEADR